MVLHGPVTRVANAITPATPSVLASLRRTLPGAHLILATWRGQDVDDLDADEILELDDPGALPPLKHGDTFPNNANRQLRAVQAGLARVLTAYTVKMRTDCWLDHAGFLNHFERYPARDESHALFTARIVALTVFTINARRVEPLPFHLSDIFQFGRTDDLRLLWDQPPISKADATYFATNPHRRGAPRAVAAFNFRYGVECHLFLTALRTKFAIAFESLDDVNPAIVALGERYLVANAVIISCDQAGVGWLKYQVARRTTYQRLNCVSHARWRWLNLKHGRHFVPFTLRFAVAGEWCAWIAFKALRSVPWSERLAGAVWRLLKRARGRVG